MFVPQSSLNPSPAQMQTTKSPNDKLASQILLQAINLSSDNGSVTIGGSIIEGSVNIAAQPRSQYGPIGQDRWDSGYPIEC